MNPVVEKFRKYCDKGLECTPVIRVHTYSNGKKHLRYQCSACGCVGSDAIARNGKPWSEFEPIDESWIQKRDEKTEELAIKRNEIAGRVRNLIKENRDLHFEKNLGFRFESFPDSYQKYLDSEFWQGKRNRILERDKFTCRYCKEAKATQVHHLSYNNIGNESDNELVSVCHSCHQQLHLIKDF